MQQALKLIGFMLILCLWSAIAQAEAISNQVIIKNIKKSVHLILVEFDKGNVVAIDVIKTSDKDALAIIIAKMKKNKYNEISGSKLISFNDLVENEKKIGLYSKTYDIINRQFILLPEPPFSYDILNNRYANKKRDIDRVIDK